MSDYPKTTLTDLEVEVAKIWGDTRYRLSRKVGAPDLKVSDKSNEQIDFEGAARELAYCKICNIYPDLTGWCRSGGPDGVLHCGLTVDVKGTPKDGGRLLVATHKKLGDCDLFALMTGECPNYVLTGWIEADKVLVECNIVRALKGVPAYAVSPEQLIHKFPNLRKYN